MAELKKSLGPVQFFSFGFGMIVGVGWIVYMGLWFDQAGPVGTSVAFLIGGLLMALVGLCYAEAGAMFPVAGGEATYAFGAFGRAAAFAVGWAMVLMLIAVVPYVSVSLAWILDVLVPGIGGPVLYRWRGQPIYALGLVIATAWTTWLGYVNYRGIRGAARFQDWLTYGKIVISVLFFGAGIFGGSTANLEPMFQRDASGSVLGGMIGVLATTPWFFGGFNSISQAFEERASNTSARVLGLIVVGSILAAAVYYALAALSAGMVGPWKQIVAQELPAAAAFRTAFGSEVFARIVLLAGLFGIVTVGNASSIAATRLLYAMGRARMITPAFTRLHPVFGSPVVAIVFVTAFGMLGNFLGRSGIAPIVNVGSAAAAFAYLLTSLSVWRLRRSEPDRPRPYRMPAGLVVSILAAAGSVFLLISSFRQHWIGAQGGLPLEWVVIVVWAVIGAAMWRSSAAERVHLPVSEQRRIMLGESV
jgi:amino acid transporter